MTRQVMPNRQVAHVWAQQTQSSGRSNNGNFYFNGAVIYSYRDSWPLAVFHTLPNGTRVVFINSNSYSVTTSQHLGDVWGALRGLPYPTYSIPRAALVELARVADSNPDSDYVRASVQRAYDLAVSARFSSYKAMVSDYCNTRKSHYEWTVHGRENMSPDTMVQAIQAAYNELVTFCQNLGVPAPEIDLAADEKRIRDTWTAFNDPAKVAKREKASRQRAKRASLVRSRTYVNLIINGHWQTYKERARGQSALKVAIQEHDESQWKPILTSLQRYYAQQESDETYRATNPNYGTPWRVSWHRSKRNTITPEQWLNGATGYFYQESPTLVRRRNGRLETSRGAEAPWKQAVAIFLKAQECRQAHKEWHRNGERLQAGPFELAQVTAEGDISIGCHRITFAEMLRLAVKEIPEMVKPTYPVPALR